MNQDELRRKCEDEARKITDGVSFIDDQYDETHRETAIIKITEALLKRDEEIERLKQWKKEGLTVLGKIDFQEIGKLLGVRLGEDIAEKILPSIESLQEKIAQSEARINELEVENKEIRDREYSRYCQQLHDALLNQETVLNGKIQFLEQALAQKEKEVESMHWFKEARKLKDDLAQKEKECEELKNAVRYAHPDHENITDFVEAIKWLGREWMSEIMRGPEKEIVFYEEDGTERKLIWEAGDSSVGIQDGYVPDDNYCSDLQEKIKGLEKKLRANRRKHISEVAVYIIQECLPYSVNEKEITIRINP